MVLLSVVWPGRSRSASTRDQGLKRTGHAPRALLDVVRRRRGAGRTGGRRGAEDAALARDGRDRGRMGAVSVAVRVRRADGCHARFLHVGRRDLWTVRCALDDTNAGEVATAAS